MGQTLRIILKLFETSLPILPEEVYAHIDPCLDSLGFNRNSSTNYN